MMVHVCVEEDAGVHMHMCSTLRRCRARGQAGRQATHARARVEHAARVCVGIGREGQGVAHTVRPKSGGEQQLVEGTGAGRREHAQPHQRTHHSPRGLQGGRHSSTHLRAGDREDG